MNNRLTQESNDLPAEVAPFSWWSWRPGIGPRTALLLGCPLTVFALLMIFFGLSTLMQGIEDSSAAPITLSGTVIGRSFGGTVSSPQITIHITKKIAGIPNQVVAAIPVTVAQRVPIGAPITVAFSQHLHFAYKFSYLGHDYAFQGVSAGGNPIGSLALLLLGLIVLPYPALLAHWGWRDLLIEHFDRDRLCTMTARVVELRAVTRTRVARPGFAGRGARPWHGIALLPFENDTTERIYTFSVSEELYASIHKGMQVGISYTPHLHYVENLIKL